MSLFESFYAQYYDLFYDEKNYDIEATYVADLLETYHPNTKEIIDLGCGTGRHANELAKRGLRLHCIDNSVDMIDIAKSLFGDNDRVEFEVGDITHYQIDRQFDSAISLFHVMSYQTTNRNFESSLQTAHKHLKPKGVLLFDFWYGPAVLHVKPEVRVKRIENEEVEVIRIAEPQLNITTNSVAVNYQILVRNKKTGSVSEKRETHEVRYFFIPELSYFAANNGFSVIQLCKWMTRADRPTLDDWYGVAVFKKE